MKKEENFLEDFKRALISTIKSISQQKDCEIKFGNPDKITDKNVSLPEIKGLESLGEIVNVRAMADSEALRLKYSNQKMYRRFAQEGYQQKMTKPEMAASGGFGRIHFR